MSARCYAANVGGNLLISTGDQNGAVVILLGPVGGTLTLNGGRGRNTITLPANLRADAVFSDFGKSIPTR